MQTLNLGVIQSGLKKPLLTKQIEMNSQEKWNPTKFIIKKNKLYSSPMIGYAERVLVQHIADFYTDAIPKYCKGILADVGCGTVPFYGFYKDYVDSVITIDWENTIHPNQYVDFFEDLNQGIHSVESNSVDSDLFRCFGTYLSADELAKQYFRYFETGRDTSFECAISFLYSRDPI